MPGCTAPNCTNSSPKGYKLYHFPSDRERRAIWVRNCGREKGWKPTRHTCICEVHFDDVQFESHRVDGLRKLKPFAVPTKFDLGPGPRKRKRVPIHYEENRQNQEFRRNVEKLKSDTVGHGIFTKVSKNYSEKAAKTPEKDNFKSMKPKSKKIVKFASIDLSNDGLQKSSEFEKIEAIFPASETDICFICNSNIHKSVPLNTRTETSKSRLDHKLVYLLSEEFDLLVEDSSVICTMCAQILNCIDYVESVFCTLSKGILNHMRRKLSVLPTGEIDLQVYIKSLKNLSDFYISKKVDGVDSSDTREVKRNKKPVISNMELTTQSSKYSNVDCSTYSRKSSDVKCSNRSNKSSNVICITHPNMSSNVQSTIHSGKSLNVVCFQSSNLVKEENTKSKTLYQECRNQSYQMSDQEHTNQSIKTSDEECSVKSEKIDATTVFEENNEPGETSSGNNYECQLCSYKTQYKAFLIHHIRQHYNKLFSCDFCTNPVILSSNLQKEITFTHAGCEVNNLKSGSLSERDQGHPSQSINPPTFVRK